MKYPISYHLAVFRQIFSAAPRIRFEHYIELQIRPYRYVSALTSLYQRSVDTEGMAYMRSYSKHINLEASSPRQI